MKYIPGSQFINSTSSHGRYFKRGKTYTLKNISKDTCGLNYVFECEGKDSNIIFKTVKEADEFLGSF